MAEPVPTAVPALDVGSADTNFRAADSSFNRPSIFIASKTVSAPKSSSTSAQAAAPEEIVDYSLDPRVLRYRSANGPAYQDGIRFYTEQISKLSGDKKADMLLVRATLFEAHDELQPAMNDVEAALKIKSKFPGALYKRAQILYERGKIEEAISTVSQAVDMMPKEAHLRYMRGKFFSSCGRLKESYDDFSVCLNVTHTAATYVNRADVLMRMKRYKDAIADYSSAIAQGTDAYSKQRAYSKRANAYEKMGNPVEAEKDRARVRAVANDEFGF